MQRLSVTRQTHSVSPPPFSSMLSLPRGQQQATHITSKPRTTRVLGRARQLPLAVFPWEISAFCFPFPLPFSFITLPTVDTPLPSSLHRFNLSSFPFSRHSAGHVDSSTAQTMLPNAELEQTASRLWCGWRKSISLKKILKLNNLGFF